jgi:hypothetical protein
MTEPSGSGGLNDQMTDEQLHNLLFHQFLSEWTYWGGHEYKGKPPMFITTDPWSDKQLKLAFISAIKKYCDYTRNHDQAIHRKFLPKFCYRLIDRLTQPIRPTTTQEDISFTNSRQY